MANSKITALNAMTASDLVTASDVIPIVDISASETQKITKYGFLNLNGSTSQFLNGNGAFTTPAGAGDMIAANNLSDVSNVVTSRNNLGAQASDADLTAIAALANTDDNFIVGNGSAWVAESGATARTSLGLGTIATQNASNVGITGGTASNITDILVADGGTGASTAAGARTNLGLGTIATQDASNVAITGGVASGITDILIADGGTGASTASDARNNLGAQASSVNTMISSIQYVIDGGGSALASGIKGDLEVPFACTINRVNMFADTTGSAVVDIWKDTYANFPPTVADSIASGTLPTITNANQKSTDSTLTGWITSITAGDTIRFNMATAASAITRLTVALKVTKS